MKKLMVLASLLLATPALAVDFKAALTQLDGSPFTDGEGKPQLVTLGTVCQTALLANYADDAQVPGTEKANRFRIALKINDGRDLTSEEVNVVKTLVGKAYGPLVVGRAWQLLDPASVPR